MSGAETYFLGLLCGAIYGIRNELSRNFTQALFLFFKFFTWDVVVDELHKNLARKFTFWAFQGIWPKAFSLDFLGIVGPTSSGLTGNAPRCATGSRAGLRHGSNCPIGGTEDGELSGR